VIQAQAYKGKGDVKGQIGMNLQDGGTGIYVSTDLSWRKYLIGLTGNYLLSCSNALGEIPEFKDRIDLKARFNANLEMFLKWIQNGSLSRAGFRFEKPRRTSWV
jgi:hypothetical protein